jgi:hypothetical protein
MGLQHAVVEAATCGGAAAMGSQVSQMHLLVSQMHLLISQMHLLVSQMHLLFPKGNGKRECEHLWWRW